MSLPILIQGCVEKNTKSQEQLYQLYSGKLFAVCLKYSKSYAEAQDNLQEGFLLIFDKIGQYNFKGSFEGWAKRVMINHVLQQYRKTSFLELVNDVPDESEAEIDDENISLDFLLKIVQELPDRYRLVFNLYVLDDYSHKEIAEMLDISIGTSKSNLARAKMILKEKIDKSNQNNLPSVKKMNDRKNIERLFQEKFKDFEVTPPPGVWDGIASQLEKKKEKRRIFPFWFNAKAAGIAAALVLGLFVLNNNQGWVKWNFTDVSSDSNLKEHSVVEKNNTTDKNSDANGKDGKIKTDWKSPVSNESYETVIANSAEEAKRPSQENTNETTTNDFKQQAVPVKPYQLKLKPDTDIVQDKPKQVIVSNEKAEKSNFAQPVNTNKSQLTNSQIADNQSQESLEKDNHNGIKNQQTTLIAENGNNKKDKIKHHDKVDSVNQNQPISVTNSKVKNQIAVADNVKGKEGNNTNDKSIDKKEAVSVTNSKVKNQIAVADNVKGEEGNNTNDKSIDKEEAISVTNPKVKNQIAVADNVKREEGNNTNDKSIDKKEAVSVINPKVKNQNAVADNVKREEGNNTNDKSIDKEEAISVTNSKVKNQIATINNAEKEKISNSKSDNPKVKNSLAEKSNVPDNSSDGQLNNRQQKDQEFIQKNIAINQFPEEQKDSAVIVQAEENPLEKLLKEKEEKKNEKEEIVQAPYSKWGIRPAVALLFSGSTQGSPISREFANNKKVFDSKLGLGIGVDYQLNKRIAIRTGVSKVDMAYNTEEISYYMDFSAKFSKQYAMRNINKNAASEDIIIEDRMNETSLEIATFGKDSGELNQQIGYIEVPVEVSYKIIDKRFGLHLITGLSTLFLSDNKISIISNGMKTEIGEANNLNKLHFSTNIGLGFKYNILKSLEASVEPMFKYQINTFSNDSGNFKPFVMGVYSGFSYKF